MPSPVPHDLCHGRTSRWPRHNPPGQVACKIRKDPHSSADSKAPAEFLRDSLLQPRLPFLFLRFPAPALQDGETHRKGAGSQAGAHGDLLLRFLICRKGFSALGLPDSTAQPQQLVSSSQGLLQGQIRPDEYLPVGKPKSHARFLDVSDHMLAGRLEPGRLRQPWGGHAPRPRPSDCLEECGEPGVPT